MPPYLFGKGTLAAALESFVSTTNGALSVLKANWPDGGELDLSKYSETLLPDEADHLKRFLQQADNEDKDAGPKLSELVRTGLRSALCLAVGVDPGGKMPTRLPAGRGQPWPVEIFWGCGAAANQFWLSSRPQPADPAPTRM